MRAEDMDRLIRRHIDAEAAGDVAGATAVYTDDVEHDVVGMPDGPRHGREGAGDFYRYLIGNVAVQAMDLVSSRHGDDFCVTEHLCTAVVHGEFLGIPGGGRTVRFRLLHVWEFRDELICRENVWLDGGGIAHQLTASQEAHAEAVA
jgi:steroid delta-isomerase-like uncharacterized protein